MIYLVELVILLLLVYLLFIKKNSNSYQESKYRKFIEIKNRIQNSLNDLGFTIEDYGKLNVYYSKKDKKVKYITSIKYRYNYHKLTGHSYVDILKFEAYFKLKDVDIKLSKQYYAHSSDTQIKKTFYQLQREVNTLINEKTI